MTTENFLLEGEQVLNQSSNGVVTLTTHRIRFSDTRSSQAHIVSMMLEKISSCEIRYHSSPVLLILGLALIAAGLIAITQAGPAAALIILLGLVLVIAYFTTRRHIVSIASDGGARIAFETKGLNREVVIGFINGIESAKNQRLLRLRQAV